MTTETQMFDLKLIRRADGMEIDLDRLQGLWTEQQYLRLSDHTRSLLEFQDGSIEVLPMPTERHQAILAFLFDLLRVWLLPRGGKVRFAPLRLQIRKGAFREPDIMLLLNASDPRRQDRFWLGADLVVEIVSPDDPERDTVTKRADYAKAGIPEYWIVHPEEQTITVLTLAGDTYAEHGVFARGQQASSRLLAGFGADVAAVLDAE